MPDLALHLGAWRAMAKSLQRRYQHYLLMEQWRRRKVSISDRAVVYIERGSRVEIGEKSSIGPYAIINVRSDPNASEKKPSELVIGKRVTIGQFNNIRPGAGGIHIGDECLFAQFVSVIADNHLVDDLDIAIRDAPLDPTRKGVRIGRDVWLGLGATILPGVTVGDGAVIAAGAVVTSDVPAGAIVGGVPARVLRQRKGWENVRPEVEECPV